MVVQFKRKEQSVRFFQLIHSIHIWSIYKFREEKNYTKICKTSKYYSPGIIKTYLSPKTILHNSRLLMQRANWILSKTDFVTKKYYALSKVNDCQLNLL